MYWSNANKSGGGDVLLMNSLTTARFYKSDDDNIKSLYVLGHTGYLPTIDTGRWCVTS